MMSTNSEIMIEKVDDKNYLKINFLSEKQAKIACQSLSVIEFYKNKISNMNVNNNLLEIHFKLCSEVEFSRLVHGITADIKIIKDVFENFTLIKS